MENRADNIMRFSWTYDGEDVESQPVKSGGRNKLPRQRNTVNRIYSYFLSRIPSSRPSGYRIASTFPSLPLSLSLSKKIRLPPPRHHPSSGGIAAWQQRQLCTSMPNDTASRLPRAQKH